MHTTQNSISSSVHHTQAVTSSNTIQQNNISVSTSSSIRTNPFFMPVSQIPTNTNNIQTNTSYSSYHITHANTQPLPTVSNPTYSDSTASISEPIKPLDGLDNKYTPEEYLQHIEARVTFPLGLQPTTPCEYYVWHARRKAFIQCSLSGTALSWYNRLSDTYKQDLSAFVQAFKKQFSSQKNAYYAKVDSNSCL